MFSRDERRALLFLFGTAALGAGVKAVRAGADAPPGAPLLATGLTPGNLAAQESSTAHALAMARPLEPGERVDLDRADAAEIERLPRIGPELARRIVDERTAGGPFRSLEGLGRIRGMGPATLQGLVRQAMFSGVPASPLAALSADSQASQDPQAGQRAARTRLQGRAAPRGVQGMGPAIATMPPPPPPERLGGFTMVVPRPRSSRSRAPAAVGVICPAPPISINDASAADLTCLPGIGPGLAARIVTWRTAHGRFAEVKDLERVPGFGATRVQRLLPFVRAP
jgi:competence ComEA-like helix-hairpin-helix protein